MQAPTAPWAIHIYVSARESADVSGPTTRVRSEAPPFRIRISDALIQILQSLDAANDPPDVEHEEQQHADERERQQETDERVQKHEPERSDLKCVVRLEPIGRLVAIDVSHDDTDEARQRGQKADQIKDIDDLCHVRV